MNGKLRFILAFATALILLMPGALIAALGKGSSSCIALLAVLALFPLVLALIQWLSARRFAKRIQAMSVAEGQRFLLSHRDKAEETEKKKLHELQRLRRLTALYTVLLWLLAACASVLGGVLYPYGTGVLLPFLVYAALLFFAVYSRIPKHEPLVVGDGDYPLNPEAYPTLYALARKAAAELGCSKEITILLTPDSNVGITRDKQRFYLVLGIRALTILSEEELYCIFLHEFSHASDKNRASEEISGYRTHLYEQGERLGRFASLLSILFLSLDAGYVFHYELYRYASAVIRETDADRDMARYGDPRAAASSLRKLQYEKYFEWESGVKDETPVYASEMPPHDYLRKQIDALQTAMEARRADWDALIPKEILANSASHPTLKMRLETLKVSEDETFEGTYSASYIAECDKALEELDRLIYEDIKSSYEAARTEKYLAPLNRITEWEAQGRPLSAERYADLVEDLKALGRHTEAEALCDRALVELHDFSTVHAHFMKGCALLFRYDPQGMEHLYYAIEKNKNYLEEGLHYMGTFCCLTGREQELQEYRKFVTQMVQNNEDENRLANFLARGDNLTKENLPEGLLEEILAFIHSVDEDDLIENIYLVRKTISETFFTSVFVIHFYGGTDAKRQEIMHKIFRFLDSHPTDRQFSLFDYFEFPEVKVEKIPGSLVYSKSNQQ